MKGGPQNIDLIVHEGEIVGLAGLVGAGCTELVRTIFGIDQMHKGEVTLLGKKIVPKSPSQMIPLGMGSPS